MDDLEKAERIESLMREAAISRVIGKTQIELNHSGLCWNCEAPVPDQRRWCDAECRDEYLTNN